MGDPHTDFRWTWHLWAPGDPGDGDRPTFLPRMLWFGADLSSFTWADDGATAAVDKVSGWRQVGWVQAFSPSHPFSSVQQKHVESLQIATQRNKKLFVKEAGNLALVQVKVKVAQSRPTLCNPMDYTVNGILQARILEWIAFPFSRGSSQHRDGTQVSCIAGRFFPSWAIREAQEYWSRQPVPSPRDLPNPGIKLGPSALQADALPAKLWGKATWTVISCKALWWYEIHLPLLIQGL